MEICINIDSESFKKSLWTSSIKCTSWFKSCNLMCSDWTKSDEINLIFTESKHVNHSDLTGTQLGVLMWLCNPETIRPAEGKLISTFWQVIHDVGHLWGRDAKIIDLSQLRSVSDVKHCKSSICGFQAKKRLLLKCHLGLQERPTFYCL